MIPKPPVHVSKLPAGTQVIAGTRHATVLADFDFETASEAGYVWSGSKWAGLPNATKKGLPIVGAATYSEHGSTRVLSMYYDLKDGSGPQFWKPGMPNPTAWLEYDGLIEAHNTLFEYWIWRNVCTRKYGWQEPDLRRFRCSMGKARAWGLPPSLDKISEILDLSLRKDKDGERLIKKFSMPRNPSKSDPRTWILPDSDPEDAAKLYAYNLRDIQAEAEASGRIPDLTPVELEFFEADKAINVRGVHMDRAAVQDCCAILDAATEQYNSELCTLTGGTVERASEVSKLTAWLDIGLNSLDEENLTAALERTDLTPDQRRALEIRSLIGSASVKKVYSIRNRLSSDSRLQDLFGFHGARTGRCIAEGQLVQTDSGLKPIEKVLDTDLLWDGLEWVAHEGVIFSGDKEVIEHDGVIATPDHVVFLSTDECTTLSDARDRGAPLFTGESSVILAALAGLEVEHHE